jgi:predicted MFS family arabinose efflux permease
MKPRNVLVATSVFHFFQDGFVYAIFVLIPSITSEFDLSFFQAGMLKSCLSGVSSIFQIPVVFIAEKMGEATILIAGFGWLSAGFMAMACSPAFIFLLLVILITGLGHSVQHPIATSLVSRVFENGKLGTSVGTLNLAGDIGKVCVPFFITLILAAYSWRSSLLVLGLLGLLLSAIAGILKNKILPRDVKRKHLTERSRHAESGFDILRNRPFLLFCLIGIIDCSTRMTVFTFISFLSQNKGFTTHKVGFIVSLVFFGGIFGKFVCGYLMDKIGGEKVIIVTEFLTALLLSLLIYVSTPYYFLALVLILGVPLNGSSSVLYSLVASFFQLENRTRGYALFYTIYLLSGALGPLLYGLIGDALGLYAIFISLSIATLLTIPVIFLFIRSKPRIISC